MPPSDFRADYEATLPAMGQVKAILATVLGVPLAAIRDGTHDEDTKLAADLVVERPGLPDLHVGVRIRRSPLGAGRGYAVRFPHDITLRWLRRNGRETEGSKIQRGLMDLLVYAHLDASGFLYSGVIVDCCVLRDQLNGLGAKLRTARVQNRGSDGQPDGTEGLAIDTRSILPSGILHRWPEDVLGRPLAEGYPL